MERLGIFETQRRSEWVQNMLVGAASTFGHEDITWRKRSLLAFDEAGVVGECLTSTEIEHRVSHLVGMANNKESRSNMMRIAQQAGIMEPTGDMRRPEGSRNSMPVYRITGHMELHEDALIAIKEET